MVGAPSAETSTLATASFMDGVASLEGDVPLQPHHSSIQRFTIPIFFALSALSLKRTAAEDVLAGLSNHVLYITAGTKAMGVGCSSPAST